MIILKTSYLARGGLLTALGLIFIYLSTLVPTNRLFLLIIASSLIPIGIISTNLKVGIINYISTCLLSLFIIGFKASVLLYIIFFGLYGIVKLYIEKLKRISLELILKFVFFNFSLLVSFFIYKNFLPNIDLSKFFIPIPILILAAEVVFFLYDYALTLFICEVEKKFFQKKC